MMNYLCFIVRCLDMNNSNLVDVSPNLKDNYDFDIKLDFFLISIEYEEVTDDEVPEKIKEWVKDKPKPNLK